MARLGANRYGKAELRVVRIGRGEGPAGTDLLRDWTVFTALSGELDASHLTGDNAAVLTTDTQKNTVYAFVSRLGNVEPEQAGLALAGHFVTSQPSINRAQIRIAEHRWQPVPGRAHSFLRLGSSTRTADVLHDAGSGSTVIGGVDDLVLFNTTGSEFWGFPRERYTTLPETTDRVLATEVSARWRFRQPAADWAACAAVAEGALIDAFTDTYSYSLQQTLYAMAERVLARLPDVCEIRLRLPNKHHFVVDLSPFGIANDNEVYRAEDRPYGLIEATVLADDAAESDLQPAWATE